MSSMSSMSKHDPNCYRSIGNAYCGRPLSEHVPDSLACPGARGPRHTFYLHGRQPRRAGNSFNEAECRLFDLIMTRMPSWPNAAVLVRSPVFVALAGKARAMRRKIEAERARLRGGEAADGEARAAE